MKMKMNEILCFLFLIINFKLIEIIKCDKETLDYLNVGDEDYDEDDGNDVAKTTINKIEKGLN